MTGIFDPSLIADRWLWFAGGAAGLAYLVKLCAEIAAAMNARQTRKAAAGIQRELRLLRKELRQQRRGGKR